MKPQTRPLHIQVLREEFSRRSERNRNYSLRAFARSLKLSQGALSEILSGKRVPSPKLLKRIWEQIGAEPDLYNSLVESVGQIQKRRGLKRLNPVYKTQERKPRTPIQDLSIDLYRIISDWYHSAILELTFVENFSSDPKWIAVALGISQTDAALAVQRLIELGLVEENNSTLVKTTEQTTTSDKHITVPALKKHQKQLLEKAIHSVDHDPIEKRDMTGMTMAIDPDLIPEAKKRIQKFTHELMTFLESGSRHQVYQMQISLFPIQSEETVNTGEVK